MKDMYYGAFSAGSDAEQTGLTKLEYASIEMMKTLLQKSGDFPANHFDEAMAFMAKQATTIAAILMEETARVQDKEWQAETARRRAERESIPSPEPVLDF